ncbi:trypsin-like peptidase domain-containing protein [Nostoc sp. JL33]|uniref:trypsin-like peptidase domain-containing protein n=1 Tax=Nostoc sp. JL33 TaxID=2815396 RepID=UPI0025FFA763|nr:trypsin-like peptidase domain-containing protein [Nostoc sp. JL33]MBN3873341.1 trypsin-like peptidase domain-containing protein [Nostoc sp. JL33]
MARILLNRISPELGNISKELESIEAQEKNIELTHVSGSDLAKFINKRLHRRYQKTSTPLTPVLNENDLLPLSFFRTGLEAGKSVCCLVRRISEPKDLDKLIEAADKDPILRSILLKWYSFDPITDQDKFKTKAPTVDLPYASGFLVGGDYLLTNRHVVEDLLTNCDGKEQKKFLSEFSAVFNYEADPHRQESNPELLARLDKYKFDDFLIKSSNTDLDYVLLKLKPVDGKSAIVKFGKVNLAKILEEEVAPRINIDMLATDSNLKAAIEPDFVTLIQSKKFIDGDPIHMIEHPGGRPKEVVVFNNRLVNVYENFLEYDTDAEPGSSGSPLFNTDWQVVGIHQAALLDEKSKDKKIKGYLGIRIDSILADLKKQTSSDPKLQDFWEKYIDRTAPRTQPQVFILAGRRRSFLGDDAELEQEAMKHLRQSIFEETKRRDPGVHLVSILGNPEISYSEALKLAIKDVNQQRNPEQQGELAIELLVNRSDTSSSKNFSIKLYYNAGNDRAKKLAESLQTVLHEDNPSFSISALPDSYTSTRGLRFCRDVNLPAVVIFVGDLANGSDRNYIEKIQQDPAAASALANSFTKGILAALERLEN